MKKLLFIFNLLLFSFCGLYSQNVTITGKITDLSGNPINNQAIFINLYSGTNTTTYTDSNGDYSYTAFIGNQQQVGFSLEVIDNCAGVSHEDVIWFNINATGYSLSGNDFSICNNPSNCSVSYTTSQVNNGVTYTPTAIGTPPFEFSWSGYISNYSDPSGFTQFHPSSGNVDISRTVIVEDANGCTASYTDTIDVLPSSTLPCYSAFEPIYIQPNHIYVNYYGLGLIDYGDGTTPTYSRDKIYSVAGTYNVCLDKSYSTGSCSSIYCDSVTITIPNTCDAALNIPYEATGYDAYFSTNGSVGAAPITYSFDYGDGTSGTAYYHSYPGNGNYIACVTMTSATGCVDTACTMVVIDSISNSNLNCNISFNHTDQGNGNFSFNSTPSVGFQPVSYSWNFGDGAFSALTNPSHNYTTNGNYIVCLSASDSLGCTASFCDTIIISGQNCSVTLSGTNPNGSYTTFYAAATGTAPFSYFWDFGNGNTNSWNGAYSNQSYGVGTFNACVTITDAQGCQSTDCIIIHRDSCTAISFSSQNVGNNTFNFNPVLGAGQIYPSTFSWDFGDGNSSTQANPTHSYTNNGSYLACLTVTDSTGCVATYCDTINIGNTNSCNLSVNFGGVSNNMSTKVLNPFVTGANGSVAYYWDFGDGNTSSQTYPVHTYSDTGFYQICLTITDSIGCSDTVCHTTQVWNTSSNINCNTQLYYSDDTTSSATILSAAGTGTAPYSFTFDFGDGSAPVTTTQLSVNHTYPNNSLIYWACVTVTDATGCISTSCDSIVPVDSAQVYCNIDFSYQVNNTNGVVSFTSNVFGATNPITYLWDFGDGNTSTLANPSHTYISSGNYLVNLLTVDANGCQGYYCVYVSVQVGGVGYNCNANFTYNSTANGVVYFNNNSTGGIAPINYAWSFGDGNTGFGSNPLHSYSTSGWYQVCLGMTDATGCYSYHCDSIYVQVTQSCSINFTWQIDSTGAVAFNSNPSGGTAPYSYLWDFGDGTTSTLANPIHNYTSINSLSACLTVTDSTGCTAHYCDTLNVYTGNCISLFTHQITGNTVSFVPNTLGTAPFSYIWYLGDGSISTLANPIHTYSSNGVYNVCLATLDATGCSSTYCSQVVIQGASSSICQSDFTYQSQGSGVVNFTSNVISGAGFYNYIWDFGDGTFASSANPTHTYASTGFYSPCLTVIDSTGCSSTHCDTIYIQSTIGCSVDMSSYSIGNSDTVYFSVATTGVAPFTYSWDFGDSSSSTSANPYHVFNNTQDTFYVCVTVTDASGCTTTDCDWIAAPDTCFAPATFTYQVQNNGTVNFYSTASLLGAPIPFTYSWDFGNGNTSTQDNPTYTYTASGNYLVTLIVTDPITGCSSNYSTYVSVQVGGVGYTCNASYTYQSDSIGNIYFNANGSGVSPYTYAWDFGDGSVSALANPYHYYSTSGYYSPCLTVTDATGCTSTYCDTIYVQIPTGNCSAGFSYQTVSNVDSTTLNFYGFMSGGSYPYSLSWDFGGAVDTGYHASYTYYTTGYYPVCVTITEGGGCTSTFCDTIYVQVQTNSCNAQFTTIDSSGYTFFVNQSSGTVGTTTYVWDFGDGNTSASYSPVHQYQNAGYYYACLTILDNTGCTSTYCDTIYSYGIPNCDVTLTHYNDSSNLATVHFNATANGVAPFLYTFDFGDNNDAITTFPSWSYNYSIHDTLVYTCVTVTDAIGCTTTDCNWVYIPDTTNSNCYVDFTYQTGIDGTVNFYANNISGASPYSFGWDMGDFTTHTLQNPSHTFPASGNYWTCVTIFDSTGCNYTHCDTVIVPPFTSTNEIEQLTNINLFPNPVHDILNIEFSINQSMDIEMTVMSATGQVVQQQTNSYYSGEQHLNISTSNLPSGVYLVRLQSDEDVITRRFVKE